MGWAVCCHSSQYVVPRSSCLDVREARIQLLEVHTAMVKEGGAGTRKLIQILTLLVGVLLELGLLIEAEKYSKLVSHGVQWSDATWSLCSCEGCVVLTCSAYM